MVHLIHRKRVPLFHNTVLILCDEGHGLVAVPYGISIKISKTGSNMKVNLEEVFHSDVSPHSVGVTLLKVEPDISGQEICLVCTAT